MLGIFYLMSHQVHTTLYEVEAIVTPFHTNGTRG